MVGTPEKVEPIMDLLIIIGKLHIYYCNINKVKPKLHSYKKRIEDIQNIEKYIVVKNNQEKNIPKNGL